MNSDSSMPSGWINVSIDDLRGNNKTAIAIGPFGSRMKSDCYVEFGVPVIRGTNLTGGRAFEGEFVYISEEKANELGGANVFKGDLVFPHRGAIGVVGIISEDRRYVLSTSLMKLTCNRIKADPLFLYYFFKSKTGQHELLKNASQVGTPGIGQPLTSLKNIRLNLPPIDEQAGIAKLLGKLDDKIELNRQLNKTLEEIAQAIFKSWFVDFEPVKAKIEAKGNGQDPERAAMCAISGKSDAELDQLSPNQFSQLCATAGIFPEDLSNSELGLIPIGWKAGNIGDVAIAKGGYAYKSIIFKEVGRPVVKIKNIVGDGTVDLTDCQCIDDGQAQITSGFKLSNGDLLMAMTGATVGKVGLVVLSEKTAYLNQRVAKFESKEFKSRISWFLFCAFRRASIFEQVVGTAQGSAQPNISSKGIESARIVVPTSNCLHEFIDKVEPLFSKWMSNQNEIYKLAAIRDALLPRLLSGEIELESNHTSS